MSVCLSVRSHISETTRPTSRNLLNVIPVPWLDPPLMTVQYGPREYRHL